MSLKTAEYNDDYASQDKDSNNTSNNATNNCKVKRYTRNHEKNVIFKYKYHVTGTMLSKCILYACACVVCACSSAGACTHLQCTVCILPIEKLIA